MSDDPVMSMHPSHAVLLLNAIAGRPPADHQAADAILLAVAPPEVQKAWLEMQERVTDWWFG